MMTDDIFSFFLGSALFVLMQSTNRFGRAEDGSLYTFSSGFSSLRKACFICQSEAEETVPCDFCEHEVCDMCIRQCERCFGVFCSFCSTINYEQKKDRAFCLSCHCERRKCLVKKQMPSPVDVEMSFWTALDCLLPHQIGGPVSRLAVALCIVCLHHHFFHNKK